MNRVTSDRLAQCGVTGRPASCGHAADPQGAADAAQIQDVGLHDVHRAHVDHPLPCGQIAILLAAGDVDVQRVGHLFGLLQLPIGAGFLVVAKPVVLQHMSDLNRALGRIAAVGVDQQVDTIAHLARAWWG